MSLSAIWSENGSLSLAVLHLGYALLILAFVYGIVLSHSKHTHFLLIFLAVTAASAFFSALVSIYLHFAYPDYQPLPEPRLFALGRLNNPMISAISYGMACIMTVFLFLNRNVLWEKILLLLCLFTLIWAIVLSGTRGVWLALAFSIGSGAGFSFRSEFHKQILIFVSVVIATVILVSLAIGTEELLRRGLSFRLEIWTEFINRTIGTNFLLGFGSDSDSRWSWDNIPFKHPHSIFVSVFFYGGFVGFLLLIGLLGFTTRQLKRADHTSVKQLALMLLVYGITVGLLDGDNVLTKVDVLWWVIWLPIALVLCTQSKANFSTDVRLCG